MLEELREAVGGLGQQQAGAELLKACLEAGDAEDRLLLATAVVESGSLLPIARHGYGSHVVAHMIEACPSPTLRCGGDLLDNATNTPPEYSPGILLLASISPTSSPLLLLHSLPNFSFPFLLPCPPPEFSLGHFLTLCPVRAAFCAGVGYLVPIPCHVSADCSHTW